MNNKAKIAEWMGWDKDENGNFFVPVLDINKLRDESNEPVLMRPDQIQFDTDWNELMRIFDAINIWGKAEHGVYWLFTIGETYVEISNTKGGKFKHVEIYRVYSNEQPLRSMITAVYECILAFINWYYTERKEY